MGVFVYLVDLPSKVKAVTTPCEDGYNVYINCNLNKEQQSIAYKHEIDHIINNDFEKFDVDEIEGQMM